MLPDQRMQMETTVRQTKRNDVAVSILAHQFKDRIGEEAPVHHEFCVLERPAHKKIFHALFVNAGTSVSPVHERNLVFNVVGNQDIDLWSLQKVELISRLSKIVFQ